MLEETRDCFPPANKFIDSLMCVLRKHKVKLCSDSVPLNVTTTADSTEPQRDASQSLNEQWFPRGYEDILPSGPSEFEEVWQTYLNFGPSLDVPDWEQLFSDLDVQM